MKQLELPIEVDRVKALEAEVANLKAALAERAAVPTPTGVWMVPISELQAARAELAKVTDSLMVQQRLLQLCLAELIEHDAEYHHRTAPDLLARVRAALGG